MKGLFPILAVVLQDCNSRTKLRSLPRLPADLGERGTAEPIDREWLPALHGGGCGPRMETCLSCL